MSHKYSFISYAIILFLFLFGLPLMTSSGFSFGVASAFKGKVKRTIATMTNAVAKDKTTAEFVECQQMKWRDGKKAKMKCFKDLAREFESGSSEAFIACQQMEWKEGKKAKKNCFRDLARSLQTEGSTTAEDMMKQREACLSDTPPQSPGSEKRLRN